MQDIELYKKVLGVEKELHPANRSEMMK